MSVSYAYGYVCVGLSVGMSVCLGVSCVCMCVSWVCIYGCVWVCLCVGVSVCGCVHKCSVLRSQKWVSFSGVAFQTLVSSCVLVLRTRLRPSRRALCVTTEPPLQSIVLRSDCEPSWPWPSDPAGRKAVLLSGLSLCLLGAWSWLASPGSYLSVRVPLKKANSTLNVQNWKCSG